MADKNTWLMTGAVLYAGLKAADATGQRWYHHCLSQCVIGKINGYAGNIQGTTLGFVREAFDIVKQPPSRRVAVDSYHDILANSRGALASFKEEPCELSCSVYEAPIPGGFPPTIPFD
jgi:hypothetical protein